MSIPKRIFKAEELSKGKIWCIQGAFNQLLWKEIARKSAKVNGPTSNMFTYVWLM